MNGAAIAHRLINKYSLSTGRVYHKRSFSYNVITGVVTLPTPSDEFPIVLSALKVEHYKDVDYARLHGRCTVAGLDFNDFNIGDVLILTDGYHEIKNVSYDQYQAAYKLDYEKKIWHT